MNKKHSNVYDRVMPRVYNDSRTSLKSNSLVMRHENPASSREGAKALASNVSSSVFSELPTVLNDYAPEISKKKDVSSARKSKVVKPRRTINSLDTSKSPPRTLTKVEKPRILRAQGSTPAVRRDEGWSEAHLRQCYSSRSHTKLKELKDEIRAYHETERLMRLRSELYKKCGVVFDDEGSLAVDKAVQAEVDVEKKPEVVR